MDRRIGQNWYFLRCIATGLLILFSFQIFSQLFSLLFFRDSKGGLINAGVLILEGLQTTPVVLAIVAYLFVQLLLVLALVLMALLSALAVKQLFRLQETVFKLMVLHLLAIYAGLLVINAHHYPDTLIQVAMISRWQEQGIRAPLYMAYAIIATIFSAALWGMACGLYRFFVGETVERRRLANALITAPVAVIGLAVVGWLYTASGKAQPVVAERSADQKPNIILIGLDSLRMDLVQNVEVRREYLPNLDRWLEDDKTAWFSNAWTPLARTYGAWHAMLSGEYPKTSGVRYNLQYVSGEQKRNTIVPRLVEQGYYAIYGSDEKRFSNIDESYGFHQTIGPPPGAADWIMSYLEDSPLHNPLRSTFLSRYLLPYTHVNRASAAVYDPSRFVDEVEILVNGYDYQQPLFLALHLCISHWPYTWAASGDSGFHSVTKYLNTLQQLDQQFGRIYSSLNRNGLLENSIVIVFTDHGEALELEHFEIGHVPESVKSVFSESRDRIWGHGSDLLSLSQNQILLTMQDRRSSGRQLEGRHYSGLASLMDVAPTLAQGSSITDLQPEGISLFNVAAKPDSKRIIFMETGFTLAELESQAINIEKLVEAGISAYEVSKSGNLRVRRDYHDNIIKGKQVGATDGKSVVAARPNTIGFGSDEWKFFHVKIDSEISDEAGAESTRVLESTVKHFYQSDFM